MNTSIDAEAEAFVPEWLSDRLAVFPSAVEPAVCAEIVRRGGVLPTHPGSLHNDRTGERYIDLDVRLVSAAWFQDRDWVFDLMKGFASRVNAEWDFDLTDADPMQFATYRRNDFFDWHKDLMRVKRQAIRKISVVLQLTLPDAYRGGRLEFLDNDHGAFFPEAFSAQGSVAVFSTLLKHRVTPVKHGERQSLTAWFKGPPFR